MDIDQQTLLQDSSDPQNALHSSLKAMQFVYSLEAVSMYIFFGLTGYSLEFALAGGLSACRAMTLKRESDNVANDDYSKEWPDYAGIEALSFAAMIPMTVAASAADIHPALAATSVVAGLCGCGWFLKLRERCLLFGHLGREAT